MKKIMTIILVLSSFTLYADDTEGKKIPVKEIKAFVKTINPDSTCLDEFLKRRNQLIIKLSASPAVLVAGTAASLYGGALAGAAAVKIVQPGPWLDLGYIVGGAFLGAAGGAVSISADTVVTAVRLKNLNLIIQGVASELMNRETEKVQILHQKYSKRSERDLDRPEFLKRLMDLDASGKLCDGSLVKQPKIKLGPKLAFKVAKLKSIVQAVDQLP